MTPVPKDSHADAAPPDHLLHRAERAEQHVRLLRDCLEAMVHPEEGWPSTVIADRYERSRRDVPGELAEDDRLEPQEEQMRREWGGLGDGENCPRCRKAERERNRAINALADATQRHGDPAAAVQERPITRATGVGAGLGPPPISMRRLRG